MKFLANLLKSHPRLWLSIAIGILSASVISTIWDVSNESLTILLGYDLSAVVYVFLALHMMVTSSSEQIRRRALAQDEAILTT